MTRTTSGGVNEGRDTQLSFETHIFGKLTVVTSTYRTGDALAVELVSDDGEPFAVLSVNMPDRSHLLHEGEFFAKTWSENEEIAACALASGIFRNTGRTSEDEIDAQIWQFK